MVFEAARYVLALADFIVGRRSSTSVYLVDAAARGRGVPAIGHRNRIAAFAALAARGADHDAPAQLGSIQLWRVAHGSLSAVTQEQTRRRTGQQARPHCLERPAPRHSLRHPPRGRGNLAATSPSSRLRKCMERIDRRIQNLVPHSVARQPV
jgi:hypothetical protein